MILNPFQALRTQLQLNLRQPLTGASIIEEFNTLARRPMRKVIFFPRLWPIQSRPIKCHAICYYLKVKLSALLQHSIMVKITFKVVLGHCLLKCWSCIIFSRIFSIRHTFIRLRVNKKVLQNAWQKKKCHFNLLLLGFPHFFFQVKI